MTTNYAQQVQKLLAGMTFDNYKKPTAEQIQSIVSTTKSRILRASESDALCDLTVEFFPFCWSVIGRFGATNYNAVEIGSMCKIQPIYIACAIHEFGVDWAYRLFTLKRLVGLDRGQNTIVQGASWHWSVSELRRRCGVGPIGLSNRQKQMIIHIKNKPLPELIEAVSDHGNLVLSVVSSARIPVFYDPRKKEEAQKKKGNAMTVVTPKTERQRLHELAVHPYPADDTRPHSGHVRVVRGTGKVFLLPN